MVMSNVVARVVAAFMVIVIVRRLQADGPGILSPPVVSGLIKGGKL